MPIKIVLERQEITLSGKTAALAKGATSREMLRRQFEREFALQASLYKDVGSIQIQEASLDFCIHRYSEQLVHNALDQVRFFLSLQHPFYSEPGYAPLYYFNHKSGGQGLSVNKSAVAAIGEGVGAFLLQRLMKAHIICRPYHDFPDLIGTDAPTPNQISKSTIYLAEVKAACMRSVSDMKQTLQEEVFRLAAYTAVAQDLDPARVMVGVMIGVVIHRVDHFHVLLTEIIL